MRAIECPEDPMKSILDRTFRYTPSFETDLRKTFARIQRERRLAAQSEQPAPGRLPTSRRL
jgi:hypothetical protein